MNFSDHEYARCPEDPTSRMHRKLRENRQRQELARELAKCVHDLCPDAPHDIGLKLEKIVRRLRELE